MLKQVIDCSDPIPYQIDDNKVPIGLREITQEEFANWIDHAWTITYIDYVMFKWNDIYISTYLFWVSICENGYILHFHKGKIRFFLVGCEHTSIELSQKECQDLGIKHYGNCWHVHQCTKCNHVRSYDSSD